LNQFQQDIAEFKKPQINANDFGRQIPKNRFRLDAFEKAVFCRKNLPFHIAFPGKLTPL